VSDESALNRELGQKNRTLRLAVQTNWQATTRQNITSNFSTVGAGDSRFLNGSRNIEVDVQWNYRLTHESESRFRKRQTSLFVRYSNRFARTQNPVDNSQSMQKLQTVNTGLNFIFF